MASTTRTTGDPSFGSTVATIRQNYTTPLKNQIKSGSPIRASHMNSLRDFISLVRNHTHTLTEFSQVGTFGNQQKNVSSNRTTSIVKIGTTKPGTLNVADKNTGTTITLNDFNTLRNAANGLRTHKHEFFDS